MYSVLYMSMCVKSLFTQEKTGGLRVERKDPVEYLQQIQTDN